MVGRLGIYLIGFATGAVFAGPFSETFGRNMVYIVTMFLFSIFVMASGLSPNIGAQLAFRFLAGFFGSTPLTCAGGSISDMWDSLEKTYAFPIFAIPGFGGPVLGPVIGSYIGVGKIGSWRWSEWITLILAGLVLGLVVLFQRETYPPLLLKWKAQHLRQITGDDRFRSAMEITKTTLWTRLKIALKRPFLLMTEPIVLLMALYLTILYIVLFTFLSGYTYIFTNTYGISQGLTNIIFVGIFVGIILAAPLVPFAIRKTKQDLAENEGKAAYGSINPEVRLWFAMLGAPAIPISLFWMGWTARVSFPFV
jgi:MFS family permease